MPPDLQFLQQGQASPRCLSTILIAAHRAPAPVHGLLYPGVYGRLCEVAPYIHHPIADAAVAALRQLPLPVKLQKPRYERFKAMQKVFVVNHSKRT